jgi:hypothetical protein
MDGFESMADLDMVWARLSQLADPEVVGIGSRRGGASGYLVRMQFMIFEAQSTYMFFDQAVCM